jgi:molybdopterin synthase catalytic subunit
MTTPSSSDRAQPAAPHIDERASNPAFLEAAIASGFDVRVQLQPIDIQAEIMPITRNPNVGAVVNFLGVVRHCGDFDDVVALELEHYPGMTEQSFGSIVEEAIARWRLEAVKIVHRTGRVALGDAVVLVVVAAPHRAGGIRRVRIPDGLPEGPCAALEKRNPTRRGGQMGRSQDTRRAVDAAVGLMRHSLTSCR